MDAKGSVYEAMVQELSRTGVIFPGKPPVRGHILRDWHRKEGEKLVAVELEAVLETPRNKEIVDEVRRACTAITNRGMDPCIVRVDCKEFQYEARRYLALVKDSSGNSLTVDINKRIEQNNFFTLDEVREQVTGLIHTLAMLQEQKIAHCSIQPDHLHVDPLPRVRAKLDYFWDSALNAENRKDRFPCPATSAYESPEVRNARRTASPDVFHNPYQSDVYSLGLVLRDLVLKGAGLDWDRAPDLHTLCHRMTEKDVTSRPTFVELDAMLAQSQPPQIVPLIEPPHDENARGYKSPSVLGGQTESCRKQDPRTMGSPSEMQGNTETQANPSQLLHTTTTIPKRKPPAVKGTSCDCAIA